jgi:hypothetical protein
VRATRQVVARSHRDPIREEVGEAEDQDDRPREIRADDAGHDGERRDDSVICPIDEVRKVMAEPDSRVLARDEDQPPQHELPAAACIVLLA